MESKSNLQNYLFMKLTIETDGKNIASNIEGAANLIHISLMLAELERTKQDLLNHYRKFSQFEAHEFQEKK